MNLSSLFAAVAFFALFFAPHGHAAPGDLDPAFHALGHVTTPVGSGDDQGKAVAVQSDGKIVVAGFSFNGSNYDFLVIRYLASGELDTTFNGTGKATVDISAGNDLAESVAIQSDGKIVVAGFYSNGSHYHFAVVRYTSTGVLDDTFDGNGVATASISTTGDDVAHSVAVQSDGKIVIAGDSFNGSNYDFAVIRLTSEGALDTSFSGGAVTTQIGIGDDYGHGVALQSDGKIILVGDTFNDGNFDMAVVR